jgi:hypothetical protein
MMGVLNVQPEGGYGWITGNGKSLLGAWIGSQLPGFSGFLSVLTAEKAITVLKRSNKKSAI